MGIKDLRTGLPVIGFAKIGEASPKDSRLKGAPYKFDHIELTGLLRDNIGRLVPDKDLIEQVLAEGVETCGGCKRSQALGYPDGLPTQLNIYLPYDDMEHNFPSRWAWFRGRNLFCSGDGVVAERRQIVGKQKIQGRDTPILGLPQPHEGCGWQCEDRIERRCKVNARLRFVLGLQQNVGGCFEFRTTSANSAANLQGSLDLIQKATRGLLAWVVPFRFEIAEQAVQPRDGAPTTAWIARVTYPGGPQALLEAVHQHLQLRAPLVHEIRQLEACISDPDWEPPDANVVGDEPEAPAADPEAPEDAEYTEAPEEPATPSDSEPAEAVLGPQGGVPEPPGGAEAEVEPVAWTAVGEGAQITKGQCSLLRAKAKRRAVALGLDEGAGKTILSCLLEAGGAESEEKITDDCFEDFVVRLQAYTLPEPTEPTDAREPPHSPQQPDTQGNVFD